jgi:hypothetical protein
MRGDYLHFLFSAEICRLFTPGRSPGFEFADCFAARFPFPNPDEIEWFVEAAFSYTVAGPRRNCTGLPCYTLAGTNGLLNYSQRRTAIAMSDAKIPAAEFK